MRNTPDLAIALNQTAKQTTPTNMDSEKPSRATSRTGKRMIGGHFDPSVHKRLKQLALDYDCSMPNLLTEAINLLMKPEGMPPIQTSQ